MSSVQQSEAEFKIPIIHYPLPGPIRTELQSFQVGENRWYPIKIKNASQLAIKSGRAIGGKFRCRTEKQGEVSGTRIWRTL